jgi:hypothetical protein
MEKAGKEIKILKEYRKEYSTWIILRENYSPLNFNWVFQVAIFLCLPITLL